MKAERDHDRSLDPALKQALGSGDLLPPSEACLDAETLAAWMDHGLDAPEVARAEAHVSSCRRCQALVGAMAHVTPAQSAEGATRATSWRWWLAPLAVGAAAATLWMVVPDEQYVAPFTSPVGEEAQGPSAGVRTEPGSPEAGMSAPPPQAEASPGAADNTARKAAPADTLGRAEPAPEGARPSSSGTAARSREQAAEAQVQAAAPAPSLAMRQDEAVSLDIVSPDPAFRWRIGADGAVDRTTDGGGTWERLGGGLAAGIVTGSAPSRDVCWLVGRNGLVLVTSNGRDFTRVAFPEAIDLTGVQASDARTASVTAADGRVFATGDGGASWRQLA